MMDNQRNRRLAVLVVRGWTHTGSLQFSSNNKETEAITQILFLSLNVFTWALKMIVSNSVSDQM